MKRLCNGTTKAGTPCRAPAMPEDSKCINHSDDPAVQELKRKAVVAGGKLSSSWKPIRSQQMKKIEDVVTLLDETVRKCAAGEIPPRVVSAIASASGQLLRGLEISALKDRLEALEREVFSRQ